MFQNQKRRYSCFELMLGRLWAVVDALFLVGLSFSTALKFIVRKNMEKWRWKSKKLWFFWGKSLMESNKKKILSPCIFVFKFPCFHKGMLLCFFHLCMKQKNDSGKGRGMLLSKFQWENSFGSNNAWMRLIEDFLPN